MAAAKVHFVYPMLTRFKTGCGKEVWPAKRCAGEYEAAFGERIEASETAEKAVTCKKCRNGIAFRDAEKRPDKRLP